MGEDEYTAVGGGLRLKGVQGGKIEKKKKKKKKVKAEAEGEGKGVEKREREESEGSSKGKEGSPSKKEKEEEPIYVGKTAAERRFEEMKEKRVGSILKPYKVDEKANVTFQLLEKIKREGLKSHKERVEEFNKYLSNLSEHHDM